MYFEDFKTSRTFLLFLHFTFLIRAWNVVSCSRLSDSGEDAKEKGTRKVGGAEKRKGKGERACNHLFYDPLPPTFGKFEIIRFRLSNC